MRHFAEAIVIIAIAVALFSNSMICQETLLEDYSKRILEVGIDPANKQQVLDSLSSLNWSTRYDLYNYCGKSKFFEALPIFKQLYYRYSYTPLPGPQTQSRRLQDRTNILEAVEDMDGDGFQQEFRIELDSLEKYLENDSWDFIQFASYLMKKHQDDYGFETMIKFYTSRDSLVKYKPLVLNLRPFFNSSHKPEVIEALRFVCGENPDRNESGEALNGLKEIQDPQLESFAYGLSKTDTTKWLRDAARSILDDIRSSLYLPSLINGLQTETELRELYYDELLRSRQVWAYKYVLDLYKNNVYPADQSIIKTDLDYFEIKIIASEVTVKVLLDSLVASIPQVHSFGWIGSNNFTLELLNTLNNAKSHLIGGDSLTCFNDVKLFQQAADKEYKDSLNQTPDFVTNEGWKFLYYSAQYILDRLPQAPRLNVKLVESLGSKLAGGSLQYYEGSWKDAINNNDGTFSINSTQHTLSLRMTYAYGTQTKSNVTVGSDTVVFQTVAAQVKLQNSQGSLIDTGTVQYYAGAWRDFGTTINGIATKELLPVNYSFRMTYAFASNDKAQDLSTNSTVTFQTVNSSVQLKDSQGNLIDQGTVQYYSGAWRNFGVTSSGIATKELLPNNYSFRMTYAYASNDKQQDLTSNPTVVFQTVNAIVQLKNSQGNLIDTGTVQYYSGAWRAFGTTTNGAIAKELLPNNYSFRMTYAFASNDKQQNIGTNATVVFQTVNASVQLKNSQGNLIDQGTVQYYSGAWRDFGSTTGGTIAKELLPNSYQFRMTYAYVNNDKTQDVGSNNVVSYSTVLTTVRVKDAQNNPVNNAVVTYYSGAWRQFGNTVNGDITKELLPANLQFRAKLGSVQQDKTQNLSTNPLVEISLNLVQ